MIRKFLKKYVSMILAAALIAAAFPAAVVYEKDAAANEAQTLGSASNKIVITGSGITRKITLENPKKSITNARVAIWSVTGGQDDLKWYTMKKNSAGSYYVTVSALYLKHSGKVYAHLYTDTDTFIGSKTFKFTAAEYKQTQNAVTVSGSSDTRTIRLRNPKKTYKTVSVAVWTEKGGQDDLVWYTMKKQSNGDWKATASVNSLIHGGRAYAHVYANGSTFLGEKTFTAPPMGFEVCSSEEEYIKRIAPAVQAACKKYGYLPSVLIAQSCLENGYGIPSYWDNTEIAGLIRYNNMVGLKASLLNSSWSDKTVWTGRTVTKQTPEEYNGKRVIITDTFRAYDSIEQCFEDFLLFLTYASNYGYGGAPKYGPEVLAIKSPRKLITAVASRGYATDSAYPDSVMRIIKKHKLTKYDK